ncbi:hypothetical protein [Lyngbya confervoides]|uniref:Transposase n=1 Tax=Lyngbya confervoides BDU141951 TaxID=1574623 RepID=A0ABD4T7T6_9CYAN|nr:hypothetical protein [Lyngbya confervoides]MCM1984514.1 hypothetical protein [Lyngbya confervoides BDU141951]
MKKAEGRIRFSAKGLEGLLRSQLSSIATYIYGDLWRLSISGDQGRL